MLDYKECISWDVVLPHFVAVVGCIISIHVNDSALSWEADTKWYSSSPGLLNYKLILQSFPTFKCLTISMASLFCCCWLIHLHLVNWQEIVCNIYQRIVKSLSYFSNLWLFICWYMLHKCIINLLNSSTSILCCGCWICWPTTSNWFFGSG